MPVASWILCSAPPEQFLAPSSLIFHSAALLFLASSQGSLLSILWACPVHSMVGFSLHSASTDCEGLAAGSSIFQEPLTPCAMILSQSQLPGGVSCPTSFSFLFFFFPSVWNCCDLFLTFCPTGTSIDGLVSSLGPAPANRGRNCPENLSQLLPGNGLPCTPGQAAVSLTHSGIPFGIAGEDLVHCSLLLRPCQHFPEALFVCLAIIRSVPCSVASL